MQRHIGGLVGIVLSGSGLLLSSAAAAVPASPAAKAFAAACQAAPAYTGPAPQRCAWRHPPRPTSPPMPCVLPAPSPIGINVQVLGAEAAAPKAGAAASTSMTLESPEDAIARREQLAFDASLRRVLVIACALAAAFVGILALRLGASALKQSSDHGLRLASSWGGFGSNSSGLELSPPAAHLMAAGLLALAAIALVFGALMHVTGGGITSASGASKPPASVTSGAAASSAARP